MLPYMRLMHRFRRPAGGLGSACMAYMRLRKHSPAMPPPLVRKEGQLGLWHNALFAGVRGRIVAPERPSGGAFFGGVMEPVVAI